MFQSEGVISKSGVKVLVDKAIQEYYYSLIPFYKLKQKPLYPPHITIVRFFETPLYPEKTVQLQGQRVVFYYNPFVWEDEVYYWLDVFSEDIEKIRESLGLPKFRENFPNYHITIANKKQL